MSKVTIATASFPNVLQGIMELAELGGVPSDHNFLHQVAMMAATEWQESITRDPDGLALIKALTPGGIMEITNRLPKGFITDVDEGVMDMALTATEYNQASLGSIGQTVRANRHEVSKLMYYFAQRLQGKGLVEERQRAQDFLLSFNGYGRNKPKVKESVAKYERLLGRVFILMFLAMQVKHNFDLHRLTKEMIKKYGARDVHGLYCCYWERTTLCTCGSRKDDARPAELTFNPETGVPDELIEVVDLPQMDESMGVVYGLARNSAISGENGWNRVMAEVFGELSIMTLLTEAGSVEGYQNQLGALASDEVRHMLMAAKKLVARGISLHDGLYFEAADAVDWWPLAAHAYGLSFTASVTRAMIELANKAGVDLVLPEKMLATI